MFVPSTCCLLTASRWDRALLYILNSSLFTVQRTQHTNCRLTCAQYALHTSQCKHNEEWIFHFRSFAHCVPKCLQCAMPAPCCANKPFAHCKPQPQQCAQKCTLYMMQTYLFTWMLFRSEAKSDFTRTKSKKYKFTTFK